MGTRAEWRTALEDLPSTPEKIPSFFFAHGSPLLAFPDSEVSSSSDPLMVQQGPRGNLAKFLKDLGPALLRKYKPKGILVFSAHWETKGERLVTDYGEENPLLMDYYGFSSSLYELKFVSRGDTELSKRVVDLFKAHGYLARTTSRHEPRGLDGRGFQGPGLDHGVFVPFRIMFGEEFTDIPIVGASIDGSLSADKNWELGRALAKLREEGILILSGGLMAHNLRDRRSFSPTTATENHKAFDRAVHSAVNVANAEQRKEALFDLTRHPAFRDSHPREEHFVPLYIAGGAGEEGDTRVICNLYGVPTFAFGV